MVASNSLIPNSHNSDLHNENISSSSTDSSSVLPESNSTSITSLVKYNADSSKMMNGINGHKKQSNVSLNIFQKQPLYMNNPNSSIIDALPYVDPLSTEYETEVKNLIEEEIHAIYIENNEKIPDYLSKILPLPHTPYLNDENSLIYIELKRLEEGIPMEKLNMQHYTSQLESPSGQAIAEISSWKSLIETSQALLEHASSSLLNLELMIRYAKASWNPLLTQCDEIKEKLTNDVQSIRLSVENTNKRRKLEQVECGNELRNINNERLDIIKKNENILPALGELELEVYQLKQLCKSRNLLPSKYEEDDENEIEKQED